MPTTDEKMLTLKDVAGRLAVHPNTVQRWLSRGELRGYRLAGPRTGWRIRETDLHRFMEQRANVPEEPE